MVACCKQRVQLFLLVNFGLFFTFWDRLLGTLRFENERAPRLGDIGLQNGLDVPQRYVQQLMQPFKNYRTEDRAPSQGTTLTAHFGGPQQTS